MTDVVWTPPSELVEHANVTRFMRAHGEHDVRAFVARTITEQEWFWDAVVRDLGIVFDEPYHTVRDTGKGIPWTDWYLGGRLNIVTNCLERHATGPLADRVCLVAEDEAGRITEHTFKSLTDAVGRCAAGLTTLGVRAGDRVAAYVPISAEVVVQMFACFKIGAVFVPIFSGYGPGALAERLRDSGARVLFAAAGSRRRGKPVPIMENVAKALAEAPGVEHVVVVGADGDALRNARAITWSALLERGEIPATEPVRSMDPALILYTSGTTGRPKGTVHSHAGALIQVTKEVGYSFDMKRDDRFFWLTDIGWMMGPWMLMGGLFHGATVVVYDGAWDWPTTGRLWDLVERHRITVLGLSPTAVRLAIRSGDDDVTSRDLSRLRLLGSTGEPWDETSWRWYFETVGKGRVPILNISGGTDLIGGFLTPLPLHAIKPCSLASAGLGMAVDVWNERGQPVRGELGYLVCTKPTPSMTRGIWNDPERYLASYWSTWPDVWNHGDWAWIDRDGHWFIQGRSDDTLNVASRRIGPAEIEGALLATGLVTEAAAIGVPHSIKGQAIACFVVLKPPNEPSDRLRHTLAQAVVERLGAIDRPERVLFVSDLPKTRSAKILRRVVRAVHLGEQELGDLSSLQNPDAVEAVRRAL